MGIGAILGIVLGCLVLLILLVLVWWYVASYHSIVAAKNNADVAFVELNNSLQQRYQDLSDFASVCGKYYDQPEIKEMLQLRNMAMASATISEQLENEEKLQKMLEKILFACEAKKATFSPEEQENCENLRKMHDFIDKNRKFYNAMATTYNKKLLTAPGKFWAKKGRFESMSLFGN